LPGVGDGLALGVEGARPVVLAVAAAARGAINYFASVERDWNAPLN
jgi:hypothetical protein